MNKNIFILLLFSLSFGSFAQKKVRVINNKGTVMYVDQSKWFQVAGNLYNKNTNGNVAIGLDTLTSPTARLVVSNGGSTTLPALKLEYPFDGATTDNVLTWNSLDTSVRKIDRNTLVAEPWYKVGTTTGATLNTDDMFIMGKAMVGVNTPATVAGVAPLVANFTVAGGDASINTLTVGKGGGQRSANMAVGYQALFGGASAFAGNNTAIGYQAMFTSTTGASNTAVGYKVLYANASGVSNVAVGMSALTANTTGRDNAALGTGSLGTNTSGSYNTALGYQALKVNTTGSYNIALGWDAGQTQTAGDNNIIIGAGTNINLPNSSGSNQLNIGNTIYGTNTNTSTVGAGNIGIGTTAPANKLEVKSDTANTSGLRFTNLINTSPAGASTSYLAVDANGDVVRGAAAASAANNGLTLSGQTIQLGGALVTPTTLSTTASNTLAVAGLQTGSTADNLVMADPATGVLKKISGSIIDSKAPLASPALTGDPTAPTPTAADNDTSIATTAFVTSAVATQNSNVLHKTSNESFTGVKSATNTGGDLNNGISLINDGSADTASLSVTNNAPGNYGALFLNQSTGGAIYVLGLSTGTNITSNADAGATGFNYVGQNNGSNTFTVDRFGTVNATSFVKTGAPGTNILLANGTDIPQSSLVPADATTTTKGIVKLTNDLGGTADLPTTPTALHKTTNETWAGTKSSYNTTPTSTNGLYLSNDSTGSTTQVLTVNNWNQGRGAFFGNISGGSALFASNSSTGTATFIENSSTGVGAVLNSTSASTGDLLRFTKNSVLTTKIDQNGVIYTPAPIITTVPVTSAGTYDILTRNTSSGQVEKIVSSSFELSSNKSTATALGASDLLYPTQNAVKTYVDNQVATATPDATTTSKGKIQLAGDLGGTAAVPTVPGLLTKEDITNKQNDLNADATNTKYPSVTAVNAGLATKEPALAAGTTTQYYRGDKTWQTLDATVVPDATAHANIATVAGATQATINTAIDTKLGAMATDANVVHIAGTETVTGAKTFSSNVGIGTVAAATEKLEVNGTVKANNYTSPVQTFSGSVAAWNMDSGSNAKWTLAAGANTLTLSNMKAGMYGSIVVTNTGTSTIAFSGGTNKVINGGGGVPTLTPLAGTVDILTFFYDGTTFWWTVGNNYN